MTIKPVSTFDDLYRSYYAALCYFAFNIVGDQSEAEDVVEDVFIKLLHQKKTFFENENPRAWLYRVTRNDCLDHIKTSTRAKERQWQYNSRLPQKEQAYVDELIKAEILREVMIEIDKLPGHTGKIIEMSYFQNMKNDQIAEALGISEKTVKNLKSKGLSTLRAGLKPDIFTMFLLFYQIKGL